MELLLAIFIIFSLSMTELNANGFFVDLYNFFIAVCLNEKNSNSCDTELCLNGGICNDTSDGFNCTCSAGYNGKYCENNIDDCYANPCINYVECIDKVDDYYCVCQEGWKGNNCDTRTRILTCAKFGGDCIYYSYEIKRKHEDAELYCNEIGGRLLNLHIFTHANKLHSYLKQIYYYDNDYKYAWIGGSKEADTDLIKWNDGSPVNNDHYLWFGSFNPNYYIGEKMCIYLSFSTYLGINGYNCDYIDQFICEIYSENQDNFRQIIPN